ncbi:hypothetical protein KCU67_g17157, partial [Aureobasidium melanogenum]
IVRERKTIQRQSSIIVDLRKRLLDVEEQLVAVQQGLKINADNARESFEEGDEKVDLSAMATLDRLDESPKQEELSAQAAASTLYDLQNIYSQMAERYAADLESKTEVDGESEWAEDF